MVNCKARGQEWLTKRGNKADTQKGEEMRIKEVESESLPQVQSHSNQWAGMREPHILSFV